MTKVDVREGQIEKILTESYGSYAWKTYFLQLINEYTNKKLSH